MYSAIDCTVILAKRSLTYSLPFVWVSPHPHPVGILCTSNPGQVAGSTPVNSIAPLGAEPVQQQLVPQPNQDAASTVEPTCSDDVLPDLEISEVRCAPNITPRHNVHTCTRAHLLRMGLWRIIYINSSPNHTKCHCCFGRLPHPYNPRGYHTIIPSVESVFDFKKQSHLTVPVRRSSVAIASQSGIQIYSASQLILACHGQPATLLLVICFPLWAPRLTYETHHFMLNCIIIIGVCICATGSADRED